MEVAPPGSGEVVVVRGARLSDADAMARVEIETWRDAYADIMPAELLAQMSVGRHRDQWRRILAHPRMDDVALVAEAERAGVIGIAKGRSARGRVDGFAGELEILYVRPAYQRAGVGGALVSVFARTLARRGVSRMALWVLEKNEPGRRFYRGLGGKRVSRQWSFWHTQPLVEVAYGWTSLAALVGQ